MARYPKALDWKKQKKHDKCEPLPYSTKKECVDKREELKARVEAAKENAHQLHEMRRKQERLERAEKRRLEAPALKAARQAKHQEMLKRHAELLAQRKELLDHIKAQLAAKALGKDRPLEKIDQSLQNVTEKSSVRVTEQNSVTEAPTASEVQP